MTAKTQQIYYDLLLQGYMFRLPGVFIRPSKGPTQDYLIRWFWVGSLEGLMMTQRSRNM